MTQSHDAGRRADAPSEPQADEETSEEQGRGQGQGQVSEIANLGDGDPISDSQAVAGQPEGESGRPDVGPIGPASKPALEDEARRRD